jgi:anti-sigma28 factor (negative regulator of flagellin synthesis)
VNADQVELSSAARNSSKDAIRTDLVTRIREEIKNGTYETPERLDAAIDGLSKDVLSQ